jgi:orotidine-5'-phosphate decarboxylase
MAQIIVALDLPSSGAALGLVDELGAAVSFYKIGSPLFTRSGPYIVRELRSRGKRVFLDLKYHDIPSTVAHAVESAAALDVSMLTLHATGGAQMLAAARQVVGNDGPRLLAVTILTSLAPADLALIYDKPVSSARDEVVRLAAIAADAGMHGVVASPLEAEVIKHRHGADFIVVTPGIRPDDESAGDQARVASPREAVRNGSDYLVVGRPILEAEDRIAVVEQILAEVAGVSQVAK